MKMGVRHLNIVWQNIAIDIDYDDNAFNAYRKIYGHGMCRLVVKSKNEKPLPISETGYRSKYLRETIIDEFGGAAAYVQAWLDDGSNSKTWKAYRKRHAMPKQLSLF